jgi:hypothetical protein
MPRCGVTGNVDVTASGRLEHLFKHTLVVLDERAEDVGRQLAEQAEHSAPLDHDDGHRSRERNLLIERFERREVARQPVDDELVDPLRALDVLQPVLPEVAQGDAGTVLVVDDPAVARDSSTWPPCAIVQIRAARCTATPA